MQYTQKKKNTPIVTLIRNYVNKKSGKVSDSRQEIQRRFEGLDWKDQKKILAAFLASCPSDRTWAYVKLLNLWDKSFESQICDLWEQYHEKRCAWVVVRHLPIAYIKDNISSLSEGRNYYFICLRLAEDKDFIIDKTRLTENDYLSVIANCGRTISEEEATTLLKSLLRRVSTKNIYELEVSHMYVGRGHTPSPFKILAVSSFMHRLSDLNLSDLGERLHIWDKYVEQIILQSDEYQKLNQTILSDYEYREESVKIIQKYIQKLIDELDNIDWRKLKELSVSGENSHLLNQMKKTNPALENLIDSFQLENISLPELPF